MKRKTPVPLPEYLEPPVEGGEAETPATREKRLRDQRLIDDDFRERQKEQRKKELEMEKNFETAINIILGSVDKTIHMARHKTLASLQHEGDEAVGIVSVDPGQLPVAPCAPWHRTRLQGHRRD